MRTLAIVLLLAFGAKIVLTPVPYEIFDWAFMAGLVLLMVESHRVISSKVKKFVEANEKIKSLNEAHKALQFENESVQKELSVMIKRNLDYVEEIKLVKAALRECEDQLKVAKLKGPDEGRVREDLLVILGLLQKKGRLLDFVAEDITTFPDQQVAAAARVVYQGVKEVLTSMMTLSRVASDREGEKIVLEAGFDSAAYRLIGKVGEQAPYTGRILHRGWKCSNLSIPKSSGVGSGEIITPAEVEIA